MGASQWLVREECLLTVGQSATMPPANVISRRSTPENVLLRKNPVFKILQALRT